MTIPVLDAPRPIGDTEFGRVVVSDSLAPIGVFIEEIDSFVELPIRVVCDQAAGLHLEVGPYTVSGRDIEHLREAIAAYDRARGVTR